MHKGEALLGAPAAHPGANVPTHRAAHSLPQVLCGGRVVLSLLQPYAHTLEERVVPRPKQDVVAILCNPKAALSTGGPFSLPLWDEVP